MKWKGYEQRITKFLRDTTFSSCVMPCQKSKRMLQCHRLRSWLCFSWQVVKERQTQESCPFVIHPYLPSFAWWCNFSANAHCKLFCLVLQQILVSLMINKKHFFEVGHPPHSPSLIMVPFFRLTYTLYKSLGTQIFVHSILQRIFWWFRIQKALGLGRTISSVTTLELLPRPNCKLAFSTFRQNKLLFHPKRAGVERAKGREAMSYAEEELKYQLNWSTLYTEKVKLSREMNFYLLLCKSGLQHGFLSWE